MFCARLAGFAGLLVSTKRKFNRAHTHTHTHTHTQMKTAQTVELTEAERREFGDYRCAEELASHYLTAQGETDQEKQD